MLLQIDYQADNIIKTTYIDNIDKVDTGTYDDGVSFCNVYLKTRKKEDEFTTYTTDGVVLYLLNGEGKTLRILRTKKDR